MIYENYEVLNSKCVVMNAITDDQTRQNKQLPLPTE